MCQLARAALGPVAMWLRLKPRTSFDSSGPVERADRGKGCGGVAAGEDGLSLGSPGCTGQAPGKTWSESRSKYREYILCSKDELGRAAELCELGLMVDDSSFCLHFASLVCPPCIPDLEELDPESRASWSQKIPSLPFFPQLLPAPHASRGGGAPVGRRHGFMEGCNWEAADAWEKWF